MSTMWLESDQFIMLWNQSKWKHRDHGPNQLRQIEQYVQGLIVCMHKSDLTLPKLHFTVSLTYLKLHCCRLHAAEIDKLLERARLLPSIHLSHLANAIFSNEPCTEKKNRIFRPDQLKWSNRLLRLWQIQKKLVRWLICIVDSTSSILFPLGAMIHNCLSCHNHHHCFILSSLSSNIA